MQNQLRQSDYDKSGKEWIGAPFEVSIFLRIISALHQLWHQHILTTILYYFFSLLWFTFILQILLQLKSTLCTQRMSVLDAEHKEDTVMSRKHLLQGTAKLPFGRRGYQEHTLGLCQHRRNLFGSGGRDFQSSGTRDTPRSIQMDSHSLRASSAMNHVIWQSRQHKERRDYGDFFWKGFHCTEGPHTRFRTCMLSADCHRCTCHTWDCVEGKGS